MGRIGSFAYLNYTTDTSDPARAKLFGDAQDKLTGISSQLLFFELELNRIDDAVMNAALENAALPITGHGSPTCGRIAPTSSPTRSRSFSTKRA